TMAADQTAQQQNTTPQSLDDAIKAMIPQAVILEHTVKGQPSGHATGLRAIPSSKLAASKSNETESNSTEANGIASPVSKNATPEQLDAPRAVPAIESTTKAAAKTKSDTTAKKGQKASAEDQTDSVSANPRLNRAEVQSVSPSHSTVNKVHDVA